ncbi:MAG: nickel pincer cofactor biosynthesis protein LarC, partial [Planctomycetaceae bacterium]|nr:nickel pincer cofactor biosynthesis protein LarC [Planctomycetaceae bacterium]
MKVVYLECATGISGDMTLAALLDAGIDEQQLRDGIASLDLPGVSLEIEEVMKGCFRAKRISVVHPEQHAHRHYSDIVRLIEPATGLTEQQKHLALDIFREVAEAEARVHGTTLDKIHFHEVGAIDSIVDIVGAAIGFDLLGADQIVCAPLPPGRGQVRIDHGLCPVPTPGTAELLKGIPLADVPIDAELTTPTGAAIVRVLADRFGPMPAMTIESVGYGAGTMDFPDRANLLRLFVGTSVASQSRETVCLLETNLDDVTGEVLGHVKQQLLKAEALDAYSIPLQMKKDRPG